MLGQESWWGNGTENALPSSSRAASNKQPHARLACTALLAPRAAERHFLAYNTTSRPGDFLSASPSTQFFCPPLGLRPLLLHHHGTSRSPARPCVCLGLKHPPHTAPCPCLQFYAPDEAPDAPQTPFPLLPRVLVGSGQNGSDALRARRRQGNIASQCRRPRPRTLPFLPFPLNVATGAGVELPRRASHSP